MKGKKWSVLLLVILLSYTLTICFAFQYFFATEKKEAQAGLTISSTITVPDDFTTIQEAINYASEGDTVFVRNGTYYEHLIVDKTLTLIGECKERTIIDGENSGTVVFIRASDSTIANFTVQNGGQGWDGERENSGMYIGDQYLGPWDNITLSNNNVFAVRIGIKVCSANCRILDNTIKHTVIGIQLAGQVNNAHDTVVSGNLIAENDWYGIDVYWTSCNNLITDNTIMANPIGLYVDTSEGTVGNIIVHNSFANNDQQAFGPSFEGNFWDNGFEGNYWSDYVGTDSDYDGIGDTPYAINGYNSDNCPLMNTYWIPADVNHDLIINIFDVVKITGAYGSTPESPHWNPHADIAEPFGKIDILDIVLCTAHYGEKYP